MSALRGSSAAGASAEASVLHKLARGAVCSRAAELAPVCRHAGATASTEMLLRAHAWWEQCLGPGWVLGRARRCGLSPESPAVWGTWWTLGSPRHHSSEPRCLRGPAWILAMQTCPLF